MMDITKSREESRKQFEYEAGKALCLPTSIIELARKGDGYDHAFDSMNIMHPLNGWWHWWKAGRESIEKKSPPKIENHMSQPIAVLDISSRTKNAILNGGISTIGDLLRIGHLGVLKVPGIGRGCEAEIKSALANLSIEWKPWGESE
ncbi:DNA-directed RNA polymerase subunit alpha C-terminal domain-containing protein [Yersinia rochesterensis]|uniref:DNA-directed RNA polymerase subunit alpha C-terminal domain-containing protein n=1 Tax=Yersinia rochesterensis TaxID=1604335 RepID=UPI0025AA361D|nr:DNA-directed RNA polymerase subunit alpha C-terminal domain-containing protein [Yersinia rochesterensis]MDN0106710.1 DNA-directed RNA polymerase subunit alpha C-terminal domain-containing protein [Yersinia rochesterensis]